MTPALRRVAIASVVVGVGVFVVIAGLRVPWHPVPGGPVHPVAESSVFTAGQIRRAEDFSRWARVWGDASLVVTVLLAAVLGFTTWGSRLVGRVRGPWWSRVVVAVIGLELLNELLTLPFSILLQRRYRAYGLSHEAWGPWTRDLLVSLVVGTVTIAIGLILLIACARRLPRSWPAVAGGLLAAFVMVGSFVYPLLVEPLFNHFTALPHGELRTQILTLADREGVHIDDVQVADASRRTTELNAYVSGFGSSRRVVLYDNLLNDEGRREVLSVVGHELGHAKHDDVLTGSLLGAAAALLAVGLLGLVMGDRTADPRSVPRLLALAVIAVLVTSPVQNTISRRIETRADVDSLRYNGDPQAFIALQKALAVRSLADPSPPAWSQFWFGTHPTALTRIAIANRYQKH